MLAFKQLLFVHQAFLSKVFCQLHKIDCLLVLADSTVVGPVLSGFTHLARTSFLAFFLLDRSCRQQTRKDSDMARMTTPLTTDANTATLKPRSSGLGIARKRGRRAILIQQCSLIYLHPCVAKMRLTLTHGQVVAPLRFPIADVAVDFVTAHQLVAPAAPESQRAAHRHPGTALHVEGAPARR